MAKHSWIDSFHKDSDQSLLVDIPKEYLADPKNWQKYSPLFTDIEEIVKYMTAEQQEEQEEEETKIADIEIQAKQLYCYLHAEYLTTDEGINKMIEKFDAHNLPKCPRTLCHGIQCFPISVVEDDSLVVKLFCPSCKEIYNVSQDIERTTNAESFNQSWVEKLLMKYENKFPPRVDDKDGPRIFGFRVHKLPSPRSTPELESLLNSK